MWHDTDLPEAAAIDSGTRDMPEAAARVAIERVAPLLVGGAPAFKKIDSLLRGHVALELAACMRWFDHCVLAPAFPFQGRITRGGRQLVRSDAGWRDTGVDLAAALGALGVAVQVRDAETDADLDAIVAEGRALSGRVLWCGTGGLAGALAGRRAVPWPALPRPVLALIGSDHAVSRAQVAAVPAELRDAVVVCALPPAIERGEARRRIGETFAAVLRERPSGRGRCSSPGARRCAICAARWAPRIWRWTARSSLACRRPCCAAGHGTGSASFRSRARSAMPGSWRGCCYSAAMGRRRGMTCDWA